MRALLLDADPGTGRRLETLLPDLALTTARSQGEGLRRLSEGGWDVVLLDAGFGGGAMEILGRLREVDRTPVVVISERPTIDLTLEAIRLGALEVLGKPLVRERVREALAAASGPGRVVPLPGPGEERESVVGSGPAMLGVFRTVARSATSDATVLLLGESGTGKELFARTLHARSARAAGPFVAINCAAIPEHLLESELFGHEKGAFTGAIGRRVGRFERAGGGTLFLDEIGDMSIALQSKILRALQEREVERVGGQSPVPIDVRVVSATHRDLAAAVEKGEFREDLYYRLAVVSVRLPPLRARVEDLERLAARFAAEHARAHGRPIRGIAEETLEVLRRNPWPGNVRQLRNAIERAVVMCEGGVLLPHHLPAEVRPPGDADADTDSLDGPLCTLAEMERRMIGRALRETGGSYSRAAERLGIHRNTLRRKIAEYGLEAR